MSGVKASKLWAGASGYAFKEWKGSFYPEKIAPEAMLAWYAERLPTVEINNTFYQMPKVAVLEHWAQATPEAFRFAIKASRRITHDARLKADAALCLSEREDTNAPPPLVETAPWGYVRLRLEHYGEDDLAQWAQRLAATRWQETHVYFMHEPTAPGYAAALLRLDAARADSA